jgi:hypothetical protein
MGKEIYTEIDIEDMAGKGIMSLTLSDNVVLTDLAYERAKKLNIRLVSDVDKPPAAPLRPYISTNVQPCGDSVPCHERSFTPGTSSQQQGDLKERIRSAVIARLGSQVDSALLDAIIKRVVDSTGVK